MRRLFAADTGLAAAAAAPVIALIYTQRSLRATATSVDIWIVSRYGVYL